MEGVQWQCQRRKRVQCTIQARRAIRLRNTLQRRGQSCRQRLLGACRANLHARDHEKALHNLQHLQSAAAVHGDKVCNRPLESSRAPRRAHAIIVLVLVLYKALKWHCEHVRVHARSGTRIPWYSSTTRVPCTRVHDSRNQEQVKLGAQGTLSAWRLECKNLSGRILDQYNIIYNWAALQALALPRWLNLYSWINPLGGQRMCL